MSDSHISVVLIAHNRAETLPTVLQHLEVQEYPPAQFEILVLDNGSTDNTAGLLERYAAGAPVATRLLRFPTERSWAEARNAAAEAARGGILLFLDADLLASPRLVARHVAAHAADAQPSAQLGQVLFHPQVDPLLLTLWYLPEEFHRPSGTDPFHFLDWRPYNLSIPRAAFLDAQGVNARLPLAQFDLAELGWRLGHGGFQAQHVSEAHAYVWRPVTFNAARARHYEMGYALFHLAQVTQDPTILKRYRLNKPAPLQWYDWLTMPTLMYFCQHLDARSRAYPFYIRRILRYELGRGFEDARTGHPQRKYAEE